MLTNGSVPELLEKSGVDSAVNWMLGNMGGWLLDLLPLGGELRELLTIQIGEAESVGSVNDEVEHGPAQAEATRLTRKTTDHFRPSSNFFQRSLQEICQTKPLAERRQVAKMDAQGWQIVGETRCSARIATLQFAHGHPQSVFGISWIGSLLESRPVRLLQVLALLEVAFRQFGQDVTQLVDGAATAVDIGPELLDCRDQTGCAIGDHQPRTAQPTTSQVTAKI
jgi:hypothetical protein